MIELKNVLVSATWKYLTDIGTYTISREEDNFAYRASFISNDGKTTDLGMYHPHGFLLTNSIIHHTESSAIKSCEFHYKKMKQGTND